MAEIEQKAEEAADAEIVRIEKVAAAQIKADKKALADKKKKAAEDVKIAEQAAALKLEAEQNLIGNISALGNKFAQRVAAIQNAIALKDAAASIISVYKNTIGGLGTKAAAAAIAAVKSAGLVAALQAIRIPKAADGMLIGNSHEQGGMLIEAEGGEAIINKRSMAIPWVKQQASYLNEIGGGVPFFARGGMVTNQSEDPFTNLQRSLEGQRTVLVLDDLDTAQSNNAVTVSSSTL